MKKEIPLFIILITGTFMAIQFFVPHAVSEYVYEYMLDWTIIIGIFALALGIWSFIRVNTDKIRRKAENWQYSIIAIAGLVAMVLFGTAAMTLLGAGSTGLESYMFRHFFNYIMIPIHSTMFSLLAFFIASAAFRAFRAHSALATVLLLSALIIMLRFNPYLGPLGPLDAKLASWIINVPNLAAKRAIIIGIGLGMVATALKVILGIERSYMGKD
jgi:cell shape-determining protein MreD